MFALMNTGIRRTLNMRSVRLVGRQLEDIAFRAVHRATIYNAGNDEVKTVRSIQKKQVSKNKVKKTKTNTNRSLKETLSKKNDSKASVGDTKLTAGSSRILREEALFGPSDSAAATSCAADVSATGGCLRYSSCSGDGSGPDEPDDKAKRIEAFFQPPGHPNPDLWRKLTFAAIPVVIGFAVYIFMSEEEHELVYIPYDYLYRRNKPFPWGDGKRSLFHGRNNFIPEEEEERIDREIEENTPPEPPPPPPPAKGAPPPPPPPPPPKEPRYKQPVSELELKKKLRDQHAEEELQRRRRRQEFERDMATV